MVASVIRPCVRRRAAAFSLSAEAPPASAAAVVIFLQLPHRRRGNHQCAFPAPLAGCPISAPTTGRRLWCRQPDRTGQRRTRGMRPVHRRPRPGPAPLQASALTLMPLRPPGLRPGPIRQQPVPQAPHSRRGQREGLSRICYGAGGGAGGPLAAVGGVRPCAAGA